MKYGKIKTIHLDTLEGERIDVKDDECAHYEYRVHVELEDNRKYSVNFLVSFEYDMSREYHNVWYLDRDLEDSYAEWASLLWVEHRVQHEDIIGIVDYDMDITYTDTLDRLLEVIKEDFEELQKSCDYELLPLVVKVEG